MYINSLNREYYTIIDFNEVDIKIYLHLKVIFISAKRPRWINTFSDR